MSLITLCSPDKSTHFSPITFGAICAAPNAENLDAYMSVLYNEIIDETYPIGAHYYSTTPENPEFLFNYGVWELVEPGRTLLGAGTNWIDLSKWKTKTTQDGAKWARIVYQDVSGASAEGLFPDSAAVSSIYESERAWSHLSEIENFYNEDGFLEFILEYRGIGTAARWRQNANPNLCIRSADQRHWSMSVLQTDPVNSSNANVETGIYVPASWKSDSSYANQFRGLSVCNHANARLNCAVKKDSWYFAVGTYVLYNKGIPATFSSVDLNGVSLWVRYDNAVGYNFSIGQKGGTSTVSLVSPYDSNSEGWLPYHRHGMTSTQKSKGTDNPDVGRGSTISTYYTSYTGGTTAHNNMQPYTKIYIWKRVE